MSVPDAHQPPALSANADGGRRDRRRRLPWRPVLIAIGVVLASFGAYELVERLWLGGVHERTLKMLHMARGVTGSAVAALLVAWLIIRVSPPLLADAPSAAKQISSHRLDAERRLVRFARWFILMRWIAVTVAGALVFATVHLAQLLPVTVSAPLLGAIVVLALLNVIYGVLLSRRVLIRWLLPVQVYADLAILTVLLHYSGGIENPLSLIMLFHVIIGGVILARSQCFCVAVVAAALFGGLALLEWFGLVNHYTLLIFPHFHEQDGMRHAAHEPLYVISRVSLQAAMLLLTAYFVTTLAERLRFEERKLEQLADRALADRQLLERSLETTGTGLRVVDRHMNCHWVNLQWTRWFGSMPNRDDASRASGCELRGVCGESLTENDRCPAQQTMEDRKVRVVELTVPSPGEHKPYSAAAAKVPRTFQLTTAPLLDRDGRITHVVELVQDITRQKETQAQVLRAGQLAAVGELAGQVAHEVNNPIAIINAKVRLLLSDESQQISNKVRRELDKVTELSDRVAGIAKGLLSYCRPSAARRSRLDVRVPIRRALTLVKPAAASQGVDMQDELLDAMVEVYANADEMEQVFLNLLLNALNAMPHGGQLTAAISTQPLADGRPGVAIRVQDNGLGMSASVLERIFEPFFTTKDPGKGTGLGLSICHGIIRSHSGTIDVTSQVGEGTCVTVRLPLVGDERSVEVRGA